MTSIAQADDTPVVVIGSGAGGGSVTRALCDKGIKVVCLEAGPRIEQEQFVQDELAAFAQLSWNDKRLATGDWPPATNGPDMPAWTVKAVGGSTVHWAGLAYRAQEHELRARTTYGAIDGATLADWPLEYRELAHYYDLAEARMGVTGTHGIALHPPNNNYIVLYNGAKRIGYTSISNAGLAINSAARDGRPGCIQLGFCVQGCKIGAKWSTSYTEIPRAEASGHLDLRPGCMALQIEHNGDGRVTGVVYADADGVRHKQSARAVCIAGNAIETPRLLLNSASPRFPAGLANGSGEVGRNYMHHVGALAFAEFERPVNMHRGISVPGAVFDERGHDPKRGFAGGYLLEAASIGPASLALLLDPNGWGRDYAGILERYAHMAGILLNGEDMPRASNRVYLHDSEKDRHGLPIPVVHVDDHANDIAMRKHFFQQAEALFDAVGARAYHPAATGAATHNMGTCRMSADPDEGVVNSFGQAHEAPNLFVSDGSVFPTATAENPTLTIVALALRQADYIASRMAAGAL
ncbi:MAG: GMC family oxidoreductase [Pseudomonadota bacterium]